MTEASQVGKKQEILDEIFNRDPGKTPFLSRLKVGKKPLQMLATWQSEIYPDVGSVGIVDGTPATNPQKTPRYELSGYGHFFRREWGATKLANLTSVAGLKEEAAHQMLRAIVILKRMMEQQALSADETSAEAGTTPYTMRGAFKWIYASEQAVLPVNVNVRPSSACVLSTAMASMTEGTFRDAIIAASEAINQSVNLEGWMGDTLRGIIDDWTNVYPVASSTSQPRTTYRIENNNAYKNSVETLSFTSGTVALQPPNQWLARNTTTGARTDYSKRSGLFLDMSMWDIGWMEKPGNTNLAPDGSGKKGFVDAVAIVRCLNPLGQVAVYSST